MIVWHPCNYDKLRKYKKSGVVTPPIIAWDRIEDAMNFGKHRGKHCIIRMHFPNNTPLVSDKRYGEVRITDKQINVDDL